MNPDSRWTDRYIATDGSPLEATTGRLDLGRLGRRRRAGPDQPAHAGQGARGRARGRGRPQLLPQPAPRLPRRDRAEPASPPTGARPDRGHGRQPEHLLQRAHEPDAGLRRPEVRRRVGRRRGHVVTAVLHPVGLSRHVGAEFDADGDGVEEAVYDNGYRAGTDLVGPADDAAGDGIRTPVLRPSPRPRAHGLPRRAGPGRARRPAPPSRRRLARRRSRPAPGDHGRRRRGGGTGRRPAAPHRLCHQDPGMGP